jgi:hypothetical protein
VAPSSQRFKQNIRTMGDASEVLLALRPVTFHYKPEIDPEGIPQFGLVAEEVEKVNPDLVARDAEGKVYTVRYEAVNAMLLNEFLKEHRTVQALQASFAQQQKDFQATVAQQQKQIEALTAGLQKVSAQVEMSRAAPQMVDYRQGATSGRADDGVPTSFGERLVLWNFVVSTESRPTSDRRLRSIAPTTIAAHPKLSAFQLA